MQALGSCFSKKTAWKMKSVSAIPSLLFFIWYYNGGHDDDDDDVLWAQFPLSTRTKCHFPLVYQWPRYYCWYWISTVTSNVNAVLSFRSSASSLGLIKPWNPKAKCHVSFFFYFLASLNKYTASSRTNAYTCKWFSQNSETIRLSFKMRSCILCALDHSWTRKSNGQGWGAFMTCVRSFWNTGE